MGRKLGIVLSGGGARGAYQIGVLKVLKKHGVLENIHAISGSSVGSLNAVLLALGDLDKAKKLWFDISGKEMFKSDENIFKRVLHEGIDFVYEGMYPNKELEKLIDATVDINLLKSKKVFVATSYVGDGKATFWELMTVNIRNFFSKESLVRYSCVNEMDKEDVKRTLLASCAIPIVFQPIVIGNKTYYDGGVLDNAPCQPLYDEGCDEVIVIDLFRFRRHKSKCPKEVEYHQIKPSKNLRGIMDFSKEQIERRYELGVKDAEKFVKDYFENQK